MAQDSHINRADSGADKFYFAAWRWHFYAGLYVVPFLITLAVTGLIMMYVAFFFGRDGEYIKVTPAETSLSLEAQAEAALSTLPGGALVEWIGPVDRAHATVFRIAADGAQHMVAVDPYRGDVLGTWVRQNGWYDFANDIHGTLLLGVTGDRMIEIAASLAIILIVTGLYLWWPRDGGITQALVPNLRARGRALWKNLHAVTGFWISLLLLVFLVSGLAWAGIWGEKLVQAWSSFPAEKWADVPLSDDTHASMNHGATEDVPWTLEQTPLPESGSTAGYAAVEATGVITADDIRALGQSLGYEGRFRIIYPQSSSAVWTISQDSMSNDSNCPTCDRTVHIDQFTGNVLADIHFADYPVVGKAMAVGIAFHEGDMGLWNLILNTVFCLLVIFVSTSGIVMWLKRRPGRAKRLAAPPLPQGLPFWKGAILFGLLLSMAFPLAGLTLVTVLTLDLLILSNIPALKRLVS